MPRRKKRHSAAEITSKLEEARNFAAQGRSQSAIAQALGISVMTFHRWRKAVADQRQQKPASISSTKTSATTAEASEASRQICIAELQLENARLCKLVADLLLEKMRLEDEARFGRSANG